MKRYLIGTCGNYDNNTHIGDGQIIRTGVVTKALRQAVGDEHICSLSYHTWKKNPLRMLLRYIALIYRSENVVLFPDLRSYMVLIRIGLLLRRLFNTGIYYNVIGGWLPEYVEKKPKNIKYLKKLDRIFVQTASLREMLQAHGINNTTVFPNFRYHSVYTEYVSVKNDQKPLRLVYMARVTPKKGIEGLVSAVKSVNCDGTLFTLDIYGQIDPSYEAAFSKLKDSFPAYIRYCGVVEPEKTSLIMKDYFLHVFPTLFTTEGYPGSVLDAFCAALPTLAARWDSYSDVITEGVNGLSFTLGDFDDLAEKLRLIYSDPDKISDMKAACVEEALKFQPEAVIKIMLEKLRH